MARLRQQSKSDQYLLTDIYKKNVDGMQSEDLQKDDKKLKIFLNENNIKFNERMVRKSKEKNSN